MFRVVREFRVSDVPADLAAALAVTFMAIPQGIAYAMIAGLPPMVGLYAATFPAIAGSLFRSSRFVIAGPTNAVSLIVGGAIAAHSLDLGLTPTQVAVELALMVGAFQLAAGVFKLGSLVDFISAPVVLGYIAGAGVLIAAGQLGNLTGTQSGGSNLPEKLWIWSQGLGDLQWLPLVVGLGTTLALLGLRRLDRRIPAALLVLAVATAANALFDLHGAGLTEVSDLAPVQSGLPPLSLPGLPHMELLSLAAAVTVLSLVESTAVARSIADRAGDTLDSSREFVGQGFSNLAAALCGGYPVSGSLSRSNLNFQLGARSRLAGVFAGLLVLVALLVADTAVRRIPIAALAGLLLVVAADLVDVERIRKVLRGGIGDVAAFLATLLGTWTLPLDWAIYLGVAISIALFVRRASLLIVSELAVDDTGRLREQPVGEGSRCDAVRVLHIEGALFFGAAEELRQALTTAASRDGTRSVVVRLKRARGLDATAMAVLESVAVSMRARGQLLLLVGMRPAAMARLRDSGAAEVIGEDNLFPSRRGWFVALDAAVRRGLDHASPHDCEDCPLERYLALRGARGVG
ncbi:MAG TPA: SulP family inorganic anion transporter [Myxococcota bacterium]|nr:SulP family inorganic anion transporter [Myxococcota bacterium]